MLAPTPSPPHLACSQKCFLFLLQINYVCYSLAFAIHSYICERRIPAKRFQCNSTFNSNPLSKMAITLDQLPSYARIVLTLFPFSLLFFASRVSKRWQTLICRQNYELIYEIIYIKQQYYCKKLSSSLQCHALRKLNTNIETVITPQETDQELDTNP